MILKLTIKCQAPDCRQELAKVHFTGLGSAAFVKCPKCGTENECVSVAGGVEVKVIEKLKSALAPST